MLRHGFRYNHRMPGSLKQFAQRLKRDGLRVASHGRRLQTPAFGARPRRMTQAK
jgi:hypothetical protein